MIGKDAPEFPSNFKWLNTEETLSLERLRGYIIILDFWTYCCINCMHMLRELESIETKYNGKPVIVIGVHSAKFYNEQEAKNIQQAIYRYEIEHPVIVDEEMRIWQSYGVNAWPTIIIIDPVGRIVYKQAGEGQGQYIEDVVDVLLERYSHPPRLLNTRPKLYKGDKLSFPGKIALSPDRNMLAISDSNNNRILIVTTDGKVVKKIGNGERGINDGDLSTARFFRPQGLIWVNDSIYVADTENHALREIDLSTDKVVTLVGRIQSSRDGIKDRLTRLNSPWDLAYKDGILYIAMAGNHQIWRYNIRTESIEQFAGNGYEGIVDGDISEAEFAQPSGVFIEGDNLFVADSEVSAVRMINLRQNITRTVVGKGLFIFGHRDGHLSEALMQHPLGVSAYGRNVYVADTYNHAIRLIDLDNLTVSTLIGGHGSMCRFDDPSCDTLGLYEPGDVKVDYNRLFIADTNNHLVRIFDQEKRILQTLNIDL